MRRHRCCAAGASLAPVLLPKKLKALGDFLGEATLFDEATRPLARLLLSSQAATSPLRFACVSLPLRACARCCWHKWVLGTCVLGLLAVLGLVACLLFASVAPKRAIRLQLTSIFQGSS